MPIHTVCLQDPGNGLTLSAQANPGRVQSTWKCCSVNLHQSAWADSHPNAAIASPGTTHPRGRWANRFPTVKRWGLPLSRGIKHAVAVAISTRCRLRNLFCPPHRRAPKPSPANLSIPEFPVTNIDWRFPHAIGRRPEPRESLLKWGAAFEDSSAEPHPSWWESNSRIGCRSSAASHFRLPPPDAAFIVRCQRGHAFSSQPAIIGQRLKFVMNDAEDVAVVRVRKPQWFRHDPRIGEMMAAESAVASTRSKPAAGSSTSKRAAHHPIASQTKLNFDLDVIIVVRKSNNAHSAIPR